MKRRTVTNTKNRSRSPILERAAGTYKEGSIEAMEAAGQKEFLESDVFPMELRVSRQEPPYLGQATIEDFEALGFVFHGPVPGDDLFQYVTLPEGWTRKGTKNDMWSKILDENGADRVLVFYKAAYYDRRAHASILEREEPDAK